MPFDNTVPGPNRLEAVLKELWTTLEECTNSPGHPWRTPVLATHAPDCATARIVVLRSATRRTRTLEFHTDSRSPKIEQIRRSPHVEWVLYHPSLQMQLRIQAQATVHCGDTIAAAAWKKVPPSSYLNYLANIPPGTALALPDSSPAETPLPHPAFAVVHTVAHQLDWLWLHPQGHIRARFQWQSHRWSGHWIQP